jgi:hypothetical protein
MRTMSDGLATLYARHFDVDVTDRHNEAMACRDLESILGVGVLCLNDIRSVTASGSRKSRASLSRIESRTQSDWRTNSPNGK